VNDATQEGAGADSGGMERIGPSLYRKGGVILARVRHKGKRTWRSTGTDIPADARKWLKKWKQDEWLMASGFEPQGVVLQRKRVTVEVIVEAYVQAGCPTRKMGTKSPFTIRNEKYFLNPILAYFGAMPAASLTLGDCDKYLDWRTSGGYVAKFTVRGKPQTMQTRGGKRAVDLELVVLSNALNLAVRRRVLNLNPLAGRGRYTCSSDIRHCREVAPSPKGLQRIEQWFRGRDEHGVADVVCFLAYSGLRIGEALAMEWEMVDSKERLLHVKREKKGITPWVPILNEMETLLRDMKTRASSFLLFPSTFEPTKTADQSAIRRRLKAACETLELGHVTPHGLRSYFVTRARESGLSDADIAMLIGDKTGPAIIAQTYGDVLPEHLFKQAHRIQLKAAQPSTEGLNSPSSPSSSPKLLDVSPCFTVAHEPITGENTPN
jgi:integrase